MNIWCAVDQTICGSGHSGPCMAKHPDKCPAMYLRTTKPKQRKPKKQREEYEEEKEDWL